MSSSFNSKYIYFALLLMLVFVLSYARDTLFILINATIDHDPDNYANIEIPEMLKKLTIADLKQLKWGLAILFSSLFMTTTTSAIHLFFKQKQFTLLTIACYILLGIGVVFSEIIFHFNKLPLNYHKLVHIPETLIQSPIVLLVLFSGLFFYAYLKK